MANRATADAWSEPAPQDQSRSWSNLIDYDQLAEEDEVFAAPAARAASAPTQRLRAVPAGKSGQGPARARTAPQVIETPAAWPMPTPMVQPQAAPARAPLAAAGTMRLALYGVAALVGVIVMYAIVSTVVHATQVTMDDLAYGRPRTTHLQAVVGHNDSTEQPTAFIGLNLNRQVTVFEIPAGDTSKAAVINGPYLFGEGEDLTPVHLSVSDVNGDSKPDLIVSVKDEQLVYINDNGSFRAINADEKAKLEQQQNPATAAPQK